MNNLIERAKKHFHVTEDGELALKLGKHPTTVSKWRSAGKIPAKAEKEILQLLGDEFPSSEFSGYTLVPRYEVHASAGGGAIIHSEQIVDYLSFRTEWVRNALGAGVNDLALIDVKGDSMEPTLSDGDLILIDLRGDRIEDGSIYVIQNSGCLLVKRIQRKLDGTVIVKSDNERYEPDILRGDAAENIRVVGRVRWVGRKL